jgi:hypothetical protein
MRILAPRHKHPWLARDPAPPATPPEDRHGGGADHSSQTKPSASNTVSTLNDANPALHPQPVGDFSVDLRGAQGVLVGRGRQHNVFNLNIPRGIRNAVLILIIATLLAGGGWIAVAWVLPQFAPTYKTSSSSTPPRAVSPTARKPL